LKVSSHDILLLGSFFLFLLKSNFSLAVEGFASLEAKREFKAPRTSPTTANQSTLISSSVNSLEHQTLEAAACETMNSPASTVDPESCASDSPPNYYVSYLN
jgi:hypothetical protein